MSSTVDIGIDLGTTNSVLAVMEAGRPSVIKNESSDLTPSYVGVATGGEVYVGQKAKTMSLTDPQNVAEGFKRGLGRGDVWTFPSTGQKYTAVNLAGLLLAELRRAAVEHLNHDVDAAVITVPAAFGEVEKHAVSLAAREGGFAHVTMIQEPVAAGLAYGAEKSADNRPFLVYDFGGGTFDAALMQCIGGQLVIRSHAGEHTLGGRDLDAQILDHIVMPKLAGRVDPESARSARLWLKWKCEEAKIRLSRLPSAKVSLEGRVKSITGQAMVDDLPIARSEYEPLVIPFVDRTVEIVRRLLQEAGLTAKGLSAIVLVGGPCWTPALRRRLEEQLQIPHELIRTGYDPMLAVAKGAALYAASILKPTAAVGSSPSQTILVRLQYEPVTALAMAPVGIALQEGQLPEGTTVRFSRGDGLWASGLIPLRGGKAVSQVALAQGQQSSFQMEVFGPSGSPIPVRPNEFSILQGISAASPPLSRSVGVVVETPGDWQRLVKVDFLAKRLSPTPLTVKRTYLTTRAIGPGDEESALEVTFVEGESDRPLRARELCKVKILGRDVQRPLPVRTEVEITLRIDPSASPTAKVFIPSLNKTFENKAHIDVHKALSPRDLTLRLREEQHRLETLAQVGAATEVLERALPEIRDELAMAERGDRDSLARADQRLSNLELQADAAEDQAGPRFAMKILDDNLKAAEEIVGDYGDTDHKGRLAALRTKAETAQSANDHRIAKNVADDLINLAVEVYWKQDGAWVAHFEKLVAEGGFVDSSRASGLVAEGRRALELGDVPLLRKVVIDLADLASSRHSIDPILARYGGLVRQQ